MEDWANHHTDLKIEIIDVGRAHFHAKARKNTYVELPEERRQEGACGRLFYNLYGTRKRRTRLGGTIQ